MGEAAHCIYSDAQTGLADTVYTLASKPELGWNARMETNNLAGHFVGVHLQVKLCHSHGPNDFCLPRKINFMFANLRGLPLRPSPTTRKFYTFVLTRRL